MSNNDRDSLIQAGYKYLSQQLERGEVHWITPPPCNHQNNDIINDQINPGNIKQNIPTPENFETVNMNSENVIPEPQPVIPLPGQIEDPFPDFTDLAEFNSAISKCLKCPLGNSRNNFVFGVGNPHADLVLVGEAPGAEEDARGIPFVGRAGQLLDKILEAVQLSRDNDVFIANILKCRPPDNRDPKSNEVEKCEPYLIKQLQLIQPKVIMALGRIAGQTLLRTSDSLTKMRGKIHDYHGIPLLITFHPAALLRNPHWKHPTWEDVQKMKAILDEKRNNQLN